MMSGDDVWFELISAAVDGELADDEQRALEEYLRTSDRARDVHRRLVTMRRATLVQSADEVPDVSARVVARRPRRRGSPRRLAGLAAGAVAAAASAVIAVTVAGSGDDGGPGSDLASGPSITIRVSDSSFDDTDVRVPAGSTVQWTNDGGTVHELVHQLPDSSVDGMLRPDEARSVTIEEPGVYRFWCAIHENMSGTLTVER